jgi:excisionase family DNA binding protein
VVVEDLIHYTSKQSVATKESEDMSGGEQMELTATEACRRLGISLDYLYRLLYSQRLPARKVDKTWRIPAAAVEERARQMGAKVAA